MGIATGTHLSMELLMYSAAKQSDMLIYLDCDFTYPAENIPVVRRLLAQLRHIQLQDELPCRHRLTLGRAVTRALEEDLGIPGGGGHDHAITPV